MDKDKMTAAPDGLAGAGPADGKELSWLDHMLVKELELAEGEIEEFPAAKKVELYLNSIGIVGFGNDIIDAVAAAYNITLDR